MNASQYSEGGRRGEGEGSKKKATKRKTSSSKVKGKGKAAGEGEEEKDDEGGGEMAPKKRIRVAKRTSKGSRSSGGGNDDDDDDGDNDGEGGEGVTSGRKRGRVSGPRRGPLKPQKATAIPALGVTGAGSVSESRGPNYAPLLTRVVVACFVLSEKKPGPRGWVGGRR